jgi:hypothetical protein
MLCAAARRDAPMARESGAMPPAVADAGAAPRALWQAARRLAAGDAAGSLEQAIAALHAASQGGTTDLPARALIALALADGATLPATAQPSGVTMPARRWRRPALRVRHALRSVLRGDEARWFLDLAGYPRSVRRHHIVHRALGEPAREQLVVCYEMQATAATPPASAEFVLLEPGDAAAGGMPAPLALDAGQLLWLAETLARGEPSVAMLEEAVGCARAALQRLGPAERLTEAQLRSPQGRQLWQAEPGRFSRVRLTAYADALAAALAARRLEARAPEPVDATASADPVEAFRRAVQGAEAVQQVVAPLLDALRHADAAALVAHLHPQAQDYRKVFVGTAAEAARQAYEALWAQPASLFRPPSPEQTALHVHVAPAGLLGTDVDMVRPFPLGYRAIAPLLDPHRVWVCWKYTRPELASGLAYDGLVWCDDHWAWFPKPYRRLASLLASPPDRSES